ncbi:DUF4381 domain-containing protein [Pseudoalteromonas sp. BDTF-M6]|uniref:DUF4381 domain-containing protein n=1 Tax=Pseudoalteromonas sp. BDTF-M6 TaxID=2796132 RepID=UPI001BB01DC0|nr:DUF4381 domain-containing protein [Pseudoalteromonas sp. BDTF-M6]MBS3798855.1 DUF4381 domain-containing protein [Pseudoalteromonas sp. BDTF-M6]
MQSAPTMPLADVIVPTEVSSWPPGPAWWLLAATLLVLIIAAVLVYRRRQQHLRAKRHALELAQQQTALGLHQLLKRLCKHYYGAQVSALTGQRWALTLSQLSGLTFHAEELTALYKGDAVQNAMQNAEQDELAHKLKQALVQFKTKETLDV